MTIRQVGILGAGTMGRGIALDLAAHGYPVTLVDISVEILSQAAEQIGDDLRLFSLKKPSLRAVSRSEVIGRLRLATDLQGFEEIDFVIENVPEDFSLKREVYRQLDAACRADAIIAVNTSCLSITRMAALVKNPGRVLGMHFMNPVPLKPVVETIKGVHTTEATIAAAVSFLGALEKEAVIVNDYPGFVTNRVLMLTINEAAFVVQDQVASPGDVDKIFRSCFGHPMGPLATADLIGLDTILGSIQVLYDSYGDPKYRPCPMLKKMVDAGLLGRKSGKGFFNYPVG